MRVQAFESIFFFSRFPWPATIAGKSMHCVVAVVGNGDSLTAAPPPLPRNKGGAYLENKILSPSG